MLRRKTKTNKQTNKQNLWCNNYMRTRQKEYTGDLRGRLGIRPIPGCPYLMGASDCSLGNLYQKRFPLVVVTVEQFSLMSWKPFSARKPRLPTSSVTRTLSKEESATCSMRCAYRFIFRICASANLDLKHTVSSMTQTSWDVLFHTTMSGRWSDMAMWGGKRKHGRSARSWYPCGMFWAMNW